MESEFLLLENPHSFVKPACLRDRTLGLLFRLASPHEDRLSRLMNAAVY